MVPLVASVVAIVMAAGAKRNIAAEPSARRGKGLATAAQILAIISFLAWLGLLAALFAVGL